MAEARIGPTFEEFVDAFMARHRITLSTLLSRYRKGVEVLNVPALDVLYGALCASLEPYVIGEGRTSLEEFPFHPIFSQVVEASNVPARDVQRCKELMKYSVSMPAWHEGWNTLLDDGFTTDWTAAFLHVLAAMLHKLDVDIQLLTVVNQAIIEAGSFERWNDLFDSTWSEEMSLKYNVLLGAARALVRGVEGEPREINQAAYEQFASSVVLDEADRGFLEGVMAFHMPQLIEDRPAFRGLAQPGSPVLRAYQVVLRSVLTRLSFPDPGAQI